MGEPKMVQNTVKLLSEKKDKKNWQIGIIIQIHLFSHVFDSLHYYR